MAPKNVGVAAPAVAYQEAQSAVLNSLAWLDSLLVLRDKLAGAANAEADVATAQRVLFEVEGDIAVAEAKLVALQDKRVQTVIDTDAVIERETARVAAEVAKVEADANTKFNEIAQALADMTQTSIQRREEHDTIMAGYASRERDALRHLTDLEGALTDARARYDAFVASVQGAR